MQNQDKQVVHLYQFNHHVINQKQISKLILQTLKVYLRDQKPEIKIKGKAYHYWVYFQIETDIVKLCGLRHIKVGKDFVHIRRYYHDYQIFINRLDAFLYKQLVIDYFKHFGEVVDLVITDLPHIRSKEYKHCYVKMKDENVVDKIIFTKTHKIFGKQIKPVRTFSLDEDKENDKKLFLRIQAKPISAGILQEIAMKFFMEHGKIRQRPKLQNIGDDRYKMIVTYTNPKSALIAMQNFEIIDWQLDDIEIDVTLEYYYSKQNKIYVSGLIHDDKKAIKEAFSSFGDICEISTHYSQYNESYNAEIGYVHEKDFKFALATYMDNAKVRDLFYGKPYVTIYMTREEKKRYNEMKRKQKLQCEKQLPQKMMKNLGYTEFQQPIYIYPYYRMDFGMEYGTQMIYGYEGFPNSQNFQQHPTTEHNAQYANAWAIQSTLNSEKTVLLKVNQNQKPMIQCQNAYMIE